MGDPSRVTDTDSGARRWLRLSALILLILALLVGIMLLLGGGGGHGPRRHGASGHPDGRVRPSAERR